MGEIINSNATGDLIPSNDENALLEGTEWLLADAVTVFDHKKTISIPIAELSTLGAGVSSLVPTFRTVTQTTKIAADGLYTLANAGVGDALKAAKNGNFWGALKNTNGASKMAQFRQTDSLSATTQTVASINPATVMMAAALFSIEQELGKIEEMQKQVLSFLEIEKEAEIEADVESLTGIIKKYKDNWDNERFVVGNHNQVLTYQNRARKNMRGYQKKVTEAISKKQLIVAQTNVKQTYADLEKNFKYYRLTLYTFSLASFMEIMLCGNFKESYIAGIKDEIRELTEAYRTTFESASRYLETMGAAALETNVLKGVGTAEKAVGKLIGKIPLIKEGSVEEYLMDGGTHLKKNAADREMEMVYRFASVSNPGTHVFIEKLEDMIRIYNHTEQIGFDDKRLYLISNEKNIA